MNTDKRLSPLAGCALFAALLLLLVILFWSWIFLVILMFNPGDPQTGWLAVIAMIIGGSGIITSFLWFPPLYAYAKCAYLQRFGEEALAEITGIQRETILGRSGAGNLLQVQLDWRWQMSNGQICLDSTIYILHNSRKRLEYPEFAGKYGRGRQFPIYFLPICAPSENPHLHEK